MRRLRGELTEEQALEQYCNEAVQEEQGDAQAELTEGALDPMKQTYACMQCLLQGRPHMKTPREFEVWRPSELLRKILMDGAWTRCAKCQAGVVGASPAGATVMPSTRSLSDAHLRERARQAEEAEDAEKVRRQCDVCKQTKTEA